MDEIGAALAYAFRQQWPALLIVLVQAMLLGIIGGCMVDHALNGVLGGFLLAIVGCAFTAPCVIMWRERFIV